MRLIISSVLMAVLLLGCNGASTDIMVEVPNFVNMNTQTAERIAAKSEIKLLKSGEEYSEYVPKGNIISQDPLPSGLIKTSREVNIVVSMGKRSIPVPDLVGKSFGDARKILTDLNLHVGSITEVETYKDQVGNVIKQHPPKGTDIHIDGKVDLTVAISILDAVPNVVGLPIDDAKAQVGEAGFENIRLLPITSKDEYVNAPRGQVLRQDPEGGMKCHADNPVDLYYRP
ncbi:MAG TPA: PASTA domain-containing protein [Caldisericia bacterium]|nr:PASTA domain-containing protein [Caldisericia bacterium]HPF48858.1 PASTA domain-containing protein [Caldisericia bacterium]HPI83278.1 PASTA domain-containing protein [Caldisericia bacterium]HPQ92505.1 PASTA domain-containing protein [Caldisericia bacterium]HRV74397.1 PASTA domain-containing protein [Caldisericia bacterium]